MNNISIRITEIRRNGKIRFNCTDEKEIYISFYELGLFILQNFEVPITHNVYIYKHLGIKENQMLLEGFINLYENHIGNLNLDLPLRALECFFLWTPKNEYDYDERIIDELLFKISTLHYYSCKEIYNNNSEEE